MSSEDLSKLASHLISKHEYFTPFVSSTLDGEAYIPTPFDHVINDVLDKTFTGEIDRLIINIPAGFGKTLRSVISYVARGFAINPKARFIHASFDETLVNDNSSKIKDVINSPDYQKLFPYVNFKEDSTAKGLWKTSAGGHFLAKSSGGGITGFRAGHIESELFSGALLLDDLVKPDDALSDKIRGHINGRWKSTFRSRPANLNIPVIVIMQRVHPHDFTYELLEHSMEEWHHLVLPVWIDQGYQYRQSGRYVEHDLSEGSLWDLKYSDDQAKDLYQSGDIQLTQEPIALKAEVFEHDWFKRYETIPFRAMKSFHIYCDTASKTKKYNDYSVFQLWGKTIKNEGYLLKQWREKVKIPYLKGAFENFYTESLELTKSKKIPVNIEDKDSGTGLIQALELVRERGRFLKERGILKYNKERGRLKYNINPIQRRLSKYARALKAVSSIKDGNIYLPVGIVGDGVITEAEKFKADDSHTYDDQLDPMNDFINMELPVVIDKKSDVMRGMYSSVEAPTSPSFRRGNRYG